MVKSTEHIQAFFLGKLDYFSSIDLQEKINLEVQENKKEDHILFLEHDNVVTFGSQEKISDDEIEKLNSNNPNILFVKTSRGGQITVHNPGQLICYPIINIKKYFSGILEYVEFLEKVIIDTLSIYEINAHKVPKRRGIWVNGDENEIYDKEINPKGEKIAAIGVRVTKWISSHGISVNINPNLSHYNGIIPCGIRDQGVTSLSKLGVNMSFHQFDQVLKKHFFKNF